ncbi:hypothetical protein F5B20DRAFT_547677 [Whalleya microplaca]|nr:hypothetical protein F5B20DRAFT_547677 [Whalleya microplaca]
MPPLRPLSAPPRCLCPSSPSSTTLLRALSTSSPLARQKPSHLTVPAAELPEYPYGPFYTYKQRNQGLYGTSKIRFGNVVAPRYHNKSRTTWLPNRHTKRLWSPALHAFIRTRMTAGVLRTIDSLGGIDEYLLGSKTARIRQLGPAGWALRYKIMQTPAIQARFAAEREKLGLPPKSVQQVESEKADAGVSEAAVAEVDAMLEADEEFVIGGGQDGGAEKRVRSSKEKVEDAGAEEGVRESKEAVEDAGLIVEEPTPQQDAGKTTSPNP